MSAASAAGRPSPEALLGSFAHELRGPLNVCMMWLDLLELKASQAAEVLKAAEVMRRNLAQQATLLRELDDIGHILGDGIELETREVDLHALVARAVGDWREAAAKRDIELLARLPGRELPVEADPDRLLQAFGYWVENAIAATARGGRIELKLDASAALVEATIADNGTGLSPAEAARFFASPLEGPRRQKTLGLRVVIGRHLIEKHGGSLAIARDGEDAGCTWTARLPLKR